MASILVVDDERDVRSFLAETLEEHDVCQAADGQEALDLLRRRHFHVVITDLSMPQVNGMEVLRALSQEQPEVEVIMLTAHGTVKSAVEAVKLGAFDYLEKPVESPAALRLLVGRALERQRLKSSQMALSEDKLELSYGSHAMEATLAALSKVAPTDATVLLTGESGTGKEVAARTIHARSSRSDGPFVAVNCAALSDTLLESELFGHERGAFTGANSRRRGRLELAEGGTFFLDEVGELQPRLQAKLLRVLQERCFERVGGNQSVRVDVRFIAATNRDLEALLAGGAFREDLYHRLAVFPITLPPLRERQGEVEPLARALLQDIGRELGRAGIELHPDAVDVLTRHSWPGNVRELRNTLERAVILSENGMLRPCDLQLVERPRINGHGLNGDGLLSMAELERRAIQRTLEHYSGNRRKAAAHLGIGLRTLYDKLKRYELNGQRRAAS